MNPEETFDPLAIQQPCRRFNQDEAIHPVQIAAYRRMTPAQKVEGIVQMYHLGITFKMAGLRMQHPDWNEDRLHREAQRISTYGLP